MKVKLAENNLNISAGQGTPGVGAEAVKNTVDRGRISIPRAFSGWFPGSHD